MLNEGMHEAIISEDDWQKAQNKRIKNNEKWEKTHSLDHEHILSGIVKCPVCDSGLYGNVNRKKKPDGSSYKDYFFYACKHRKMIDGHLCDYRRQWNEEFINSAVEEFIRKLVQNPDFDAALRKRINAQIDTKELNAELETLQKQLRQVTGAKDKLSLQLDALDITDRHYDKKYADMLDRLERLYDKISDTESEIENVKTRIQNIEMDKISADNVYELLLRFNMLYDRFSDTEKKAFLRSFIERIDIYPEKQQNGQILKHIRFRFPVFYKNQDVFDISWDNETTVETVVLMSRKDT